ncbi:MAG: DUF547 domain-containing protein [Gemmatimonadales bacterium]
MKYRNVRGLSLVGMLVLAAPHLGAQEVPDHAAFEAVLQQHVHGKLFDYGAVAKDSAGLTDYLLQLANTDPGVLEAAGRQQQLAFWINAYNACTVKLVVDHYPIRKGGLAASLVNSVKGVPANSIRQIPNTWSDKFCNVAGTARSLDEIEHEILRPMGDPRIHFAVNCASRSCPVLSSHAYTAKRLDDQLDDAVRRFVADSMQYRLNRKKSALEVNRILDWYKDDFGGTEGVIRFLLYYIPDADVQFIRTHPKIEVRYNRYDWTLNDTAVFGSGG